jgi:hypothetical protein
MMLSPALRGRAKFEPPLRGELTDIKVKGLFAEIRSTVLMIAFGIRF